VVKVPPLMVIVPVLCRKTLKAVADRLALNTGPAAIWILALSVVELGTTPPIQFEVLVQLPSAAPLFQVLSAAEDIAVKVSSRTMETNRLYFPDMIFFS
jgi:hypothetical protein